MTDSSIGHASEISGPDTVEIRTLVQLLSKYPSDPDLLIKLAKINEKYGKYDEAITLLQKARSISHDYEDIYLLEAIMLAKLNNQSACRQKSLLNKAYRRVKVRNNTDAFDRYINSIHLGYFETEVGSGYDKLSNNRGHWTNNYFLGKYVDCSNNSYYGGYEKVKRYEINNEEYHIGLAVPLNYFSYALEYRASSQHNLLPIKTYYGLLRYGFGSDLGAQLIYTNRKYTEIESSSYGVGLNYYFSNYQLVLSRAWNKTKSKDKEFDAATVDKLGITYYMQKYQYIGLTLSRGTELTYDHTNNPPYSKTKTILLKGLYPLFHNLAMTYEMKRHNQVGYFNQSGVRLGVRYQYK